MAVQSELKGMKEVREGLAEFSKTVQRNIGRRALERPAQIIGEAAEARAPVSDRPDNPTPGSLRASKEVKRAKGREMATVAVIFEDVAAVPTEYGTSRMAARPWFRPAADAVEAAAIAAFASALTIEVESAAAKAAKKSKAKGS